MPAPISSGSPSAIPRAPPAASANASPAAASPIAGSRSQIDSRSVSMTNKTQIATWVHDYGEDSDFVRVRVKGEFPRAGTMQFIDSERVQHAMERELPPESGSALVMGVDIARQGGDQTVIRFRRGPRCPLDPAGEVPHPRPDGGREPRHGAGQRPQSRRRLRRRHGHRLGRRRSPEPARLLGLVRGVDFGARADRTDGVDAMVRYANKRAEMWGYMKDWCKVGLPARRPRPARRPHRRRLRLRRRGRHPARAKGRHAPPRPCLARRWRCAGAHLRLSGVQDATGPRSAVSRRSSPGSSAMSCEWETRRRETASCATDST